jgi:hypothetical protein
MTWDGEALTDRLSSKATASTRVARVEFEIKEWFCRKLLKTQEQSNGRDDWIRISDLTDEIGGPIFNAIVATGLTT